MRFSGRRGRGRLVVAHDQVVAFDEVNATRFLCLRRRAGMVALAAACRVRIGTGVRFGLLLTHHVVVIVEMVVVKEELRVERSRLLVAVMTRHGCTGCRIEGTHAGGMVGSTGVGQTGQSGPLVVLVQVTARDRRVGTGQTGLQQPVCSTASAGNR